MTLDRRGEARHPANNQAGLQRHTCARDTRAACPPHPPMYWTAEQYRAALAGEPLTLRAVQKRLARWYRTGQVRVVRETLAARGPGAPPRVRYLLDVSSWRAATGIHDATQGQDHARPGRAA